MLNINNCCSIILRRFSISKTSSSNLMSNIWKLVFSDLNPFTRSLYLFLCARYFQISVLLFSKHYVWRKVYFVEINNENSEKGLLYVITSWHTYIFHNANTQYTFTHIYTTYNRNTNNVRGIIIIDKIYN